MSKEYSVIKEKKRTLLCHFKNDNKLIKIYIEAIDEKITKELDKQVKDETFIYYLNCENNKIDATRILGYGKIDVTAKSDIKFINSLIIMPEKGFVATSSFNYEFGTIHTEEDTTIVKKYRCWNKLQLFKERHCEINKAPYIIIYKEISTPKHK